MDNLRYEVIESNVDPEKDKRPTKSKKKHTLYRDEKSKTHRTINGVGIIGRLFK